MKIISKYKDYYDYLTGIYGEDPKLILDRRNRESYLLPCCGKITFYIAGYVIEGLVLENRDIVYGKFIEQYILDNTKYKRLSWLYYSRDLLRNYEKSYYVKYKDREDWYYLKPEKDLENTNKLHNCPILLKTVYGTYRYPKLATLKVPTLVDAETIYQWLTEWLSNQITEKEKQIKPISDKLKIQNKGFDIKKSFRPNIK